MALLGQAGMLRRGRQNLENNCPAMAPTCRVVATILVIPIYLEAAGLVILVPSYQTPM
jgi:hypothetical protein